MNTQHVVNLIGVPLDLGAEALGVDRGPKAIRDRQIVQKLIDAGLTVADKGDMNAHKREGLDIGDPNMPYVKEIARVCEELASTVDTAIQNGEKPVVLGGDHSVNLGAFSGAAASVDSPLGLIYIDAHGDMNTPETSLSHNIHGMHLASLMGFGPDVMTQLYRPEVKLPKENLLHIAGSDLDQAEIDLIERENINGYTILDLLKNGMGPLFSMIDDLCNRVDSVWVSVDLDAIDTVYAPGVGIPNQGGLTYREVAALMTYIGSRCNVVGLYLVEYNPNFDIDHKTDELSIEIIAKLLGTDHSWYTNYMARQK